MTQPKIPEWMRVTQDQLRAIDIGAKILPLTRAEVANGMIARGPIITAAMEGTDAASAKQLPVPCHNIYLEKTPYGRWTMHFFSTPVKGHSIAIEPRIRFSEPAGGLVVMTVKHGMVLMRKLKRGDRSVYAGIDTSATSVDAIAKQVWDGWSV